MTKQKIKNNHGTVINNVEHLIVDELAVVNCYCIFKNTEVNNASDVEVIVSQRELDLRIGMMIFMMITSAFVFAFIYPSWWLESELFPYFTVGSWVLAVVFTVIAVAIHKNRTIIGQMVINNVLRSKEEAISA